MSLRLFVALDVIIAPLIATGAFSLWDLFYVISLSPLAMMRPVVAGPVLLFSITLEVWTHMAFEWLLVGFQVLPVLGQSSSLTVGRM